MTDGTAYRFKTEEQLKRCLRIALPERLSLSAGTPSAMPDLGPGVLNAALSDSEEWLWIDSSGALRRDVDCAGPLVGRAERVLHDRENIWTLTAEAVHRIDGRSLQLIASFGRGDIIDIAPDGHGGAWLLSAEAIKQVDGSGRLLSQTIPLHERGDSIAAAGESKALLIKARNGLILFAGGTSVEINLAEVLVDGPRFVARTLSSSKRGFVLEGDWDGTPGVLLLDVNGEPSAWGTWEDEPPEMVLTAGSDLYAVHVESGRVLRFAGAAEAGGTLWLTPVLESDTLAGDWLRADAEVVLPERATITMRWASTKNEGLKSTAEAVRADTEKSVGARVRTLRNMLDWSDIARTYSGRTIDEEPIAEGFSFPLHEAKEKGNFLWVELAIYRNRAEAPPELKGLAVHHDAPTLMDNLPAVYSSPDGDLDGLMRRLVAVLEATTQDLDERIGRLADRLDPARTEDRWLPGLAALLGLPFHASLDPRQQRRMLQAASGILAGRGTREGVITLLNAIFPNTPFRVVDRTETVTPIMLGGGAVRGASLPAYLSGPSSKVPKLNARLVLGQTGLSKATPCDPLSVMRPPELLVEIAASPRDQRRFGAAVRHMIEAMLPAGVRLRLRWTTGMRGTGEPVTIIRDPRPMVLGEATPIRGIRLGGDPKPRLREEGIAMGHRLQ